MTLLCILNHRVFGGAFAEMPFVATREGYRREGNLKRFLEVTLNAILLPKCLSSCMNVQMRTFSSSACQHRRVSRTECMLQAMESKLRALGVRRLVVQSVRSLLPMWLGSLGFMPLTLAEADALDPLLVSPDPDSAQLIKKSLLPGSASFNHAFHYTLYTLPVRSKQGCDPWPNCCRLYGFVITMMAGSRHALPCLCNSRHRVRCSAATMLMDSANGSAFQL